MAQDIQQDHSGKLSAWREALELFDRYVQLNPSAQTTLINELTEHEPQVRELFLKCLEHESAADAARAVQPTVVGRLTRG